MLPRRHQLNSLLKNIKNGIEALGGISDLSGALSDFYTSSKRNEQAKEQLIVTIISCICSEFGINKRQLIAIRGKAPIQQAKRICTCLLYFEAEMTIRGISRRIFKTDSHNYFGSYVRRHKSLNLEIKPDQEYIAGYNKVLDQVKLKMKEFEQK